MHIFLNGLAASSSSGLTYLRNVIPQLSCQSGIRTTVALNPVLRQEFADLPNVSVLDIRPSPGIVRRVWLEQTALRRLIKQVEADVLISAGNFALWRSPVPQILLSGNSLYTSADFFGDLRNRREYAIWLDTRIKGWFARRSTKWADCTAAPSQAFARELEQWGCGHVAGIYHGFDPKIFLSDDTPLNSEIHRRLDTEPGVLRLLFVSHYNYYRNFETLFRALPILRERLHPRKIRLFLTCKLQSEENPGSYRAERAAALVDQLGLSDEVVELGTIPYRQLHHVYKASDIYVSPAYAETFAHPLVEAMACGLPVLASDLPVHREVCASAALYFHRFSPDELAEQLIRLANSSDLRTELSTGGLARSRRFSWAKHVAELLQLVRTLISPREERFTEPSLVA